jgi:oligopeptidase B
LKETIYQDFLRYIQETDYTTPSMKNDFIYYQRTFEGKSYSVHCRAPVPNKSSSKDFYVMAQEWDKSANTTILPGEHVLLDENDLAEGKSHCHVGTVQVSPSGKLLAYTVDETGGEKYSLIVQNIETKQDCLAEPINDIDSTVVWGPDDTSLYYLRFDDTHRPFQVYKHILSAVSSHTPQPNDQLLFQEDDELFWVSIDKSQDEKFLFIDTSSKETSEVHFIELSCKQGPSESSYHDVVSCVSKRRNKVLYSVEHYRGNFLIATNVGGTKNMRFMVAPVMEHSQDLWEDVRSTMHSQVLFTGGAEKCLEAIHPFESHVVLSGREDGMPSIWVAQFEDCGNNVQSFSKLEFEEEVHDVGLGPNHEYVTDSILISYDSLITPTQSILLPLKDPNNERRIVKEKHVPGYDKSLYTCERFSVPSRDGTARIPVSMVYRKGTIPTNGTNWRQQNIEYPVNVHLYGYGSYGMVGLFFFPVHLY